MSDLEPTHPPEPPAPAAPASTNGPVQAPQAFHPALTGLAGLVVGSILLGKKAGLLAGLVGAGAKVLLEPKPKTEPTPVPPGPMPVDLAPAPIPVVPVQTTEAQISTPLVPETILNSPEPVSIPDPAPLPALISSEPMAELSALPVLSKPEPQPESTPDPSLPTPPEARAETTGPVALSVPVVAEASIETLPPPPDALAPFPSSLAQEILTEPITPAEPVLVEAPTDTLTHAVAAPEPVSTSFPLPTGEPVSALDAAPPLVEPLLEISPEQIPAAETPQSTAAAAAEAELGRSPETFPTPAPATLPPDALDQALSHAEEFRNYGAPATSGPLVLEEIPLPYLPSELPSATDPSILLPQPEVATPVEPFVQWPETDPNAPSLSAFQAFVANVFQSEDEPAPPPAPTLPPDPIEAISVSEISTTQPPPATPSPTPAAELPTQTPASGMGGMGGITPDDIWRLASAAPLDLPTEPALTELASPDAQPDLALPTIPETPAENPPPVELVSEPFPALAISPEDLAIPAPQAAAPVPDFLTFAATTLAETPPQTVPEPTTSHPSHPPGIAPFVELFGTKPAAAATELFAQSAPSAERDFPSFQQPRAALLTVEEERSLADPGIFKIDTTSPPMAASVTAPTAGAVPGFAPRFSPPVAKPRSARRGMGKFKILTILTLLAALIGGGLAKREFLLKQWNAWLQTPPPVAMPTKAKTPPPPDAAPSATIVERPSAPAVKPNPATDVPAPPVKSTAITPIEVRPAADPPSAPVPTPTAPPQATPSPTDPELAGQVEAEAAIKTFLGTTQLDSLLGQVLDRERVTPGVRKYFEAHPLAATPFTEVVLDSGARTTESNARAFLFRVRSQDRPAGFPVCAEQTAEGYKIEWNAFIQCRDRIAANFWKTPEAPPTSLYIILKRSHYFGDDMTELDAFDCFRINSPNPDEEPVYAFARKDSAFSKKFRNQITWDANYFAVAVFSHAKNTQGAVHHELVDIERFNWRAAK